MDLATFVNLKMEEKNLTPTDVERDSGNAVTDTYVAKIMAGKAKNLTVETILGLAKGLDVHPVEVFKAAAGVEEPEGGWTAESLVRANQRMLNQKPREIKQIKKILKIE